MTKKTKRQSFVKQKLTNGMKKLFQEKKLLGKSTLLLADWLYPTEKLLKIYLKLDVQTVEF